MELHNTLGLRIRAARRRANLSQGELAHRLKVSRSAVANWESTAGTLPGSRRLVAIATATGVSHGWLLSGQGPMALETALRTSSRSDRSRADHALEQRMLTAFRTYDPARQLALVTLMESDAA